MNNQEYRLIAQNELERFFNKARILQKEKKKKYGESWQDGRPIGVTDNIFWITIRIQNMEKVLTLLQIKFAEAIDENLQVDLELQMSELHGKIEDDLLDLANFAGFRWVMNEDRRDTL